MHSVTAIHQQLKDEIQQTERRLAMLYRTQLALDRLIRQVHELKMQVKKLQAAGSATAAR